MERWFSLEDPTRLEPAERELFVETELESGLRLRGVIDRVDVAPTGEVRIVDYKTGKAPAPGVRGGRAVPDEVLRPGDLAAEEAWCRAGSSSSIWAAAMC